MKVVKPFKRNSWGIFYKVREIGDIDKKFIDSLDWPEDICLGISFRPVLLGKALEKRIKFPTGYKATLCCYSPGRGVSKTFPVASSFGIEARTPLNLAELRRIQRTMTANLVKEKKGGLTEQFKKALKAYIQKSLGKTKSLIVMRKNRPEGLFSLLPAVGGNAQPVKYDGITWHQFPREMSTNEKRSAYYLVSSWLKAVAELQVAVKISPEDVAFASFLAGIGFTLNNIQFSRKAKNP